MTARRDSGRRGRVRAPAAAAALAAAAIYGLLPDTLIVGPRFVVPCLEVALIVAVMVTNPHRSDRHSRWSRGMSVALIGLIALTNLVSLVLLIGQLISSSTSHGRLLLLGAGQVWITNVIVFAAAYWELDRGGPVARTRTNRQRLALADFRFTQNEDADTAPEVAAGSSQRNDWVPTFVDYLYVSLTNSSAFSPTDTMPLSPRAKVLMGVEATAALVTSVPVIAKGVSGLGK
ncbi:MAG: hypothetical protein M3140_00715 [Actinomycetota bacterium]|nr:hypothetical protein [Actinomycetota bacterium]